MAEDRYLTAAQENGTVHISEEVIASIVAMAVLETDGVRGLGTEHGPGQPERLGRRGLGRHIHLSFGEESVSIACDVTLLFGYSVIETAQTIQERVTTAVESMTGCKVLGVDVNVCGIALPK